MTEEEAKRKACCGPVGSGVATGQCQWVESDDVEYVVMWPTRSCMGSACMAWRWEQIPHRWDDNVTSEHSPSNGYCGLAGKP